MKPNFVVNKIDNFLMDRVNNRPVITCYFSESAEIRQVCVPNGEGTAA